MTGGPDILDCLRDALGAKPAGVSETGACRAPVPSGIDGGAGR